MARPRKPTLQLIVEMFDDLDLARQQQALEALELNHYLAKRRAAKKLAPPPADEPLLRDADAQGD